MSGGPGGPGQSPQPGPGGDSEPDAEDFAPDAFEPLLGYRVFAVTQQGVLNSPVIEEAWEPGANAAHCVLSGHRAPHPGCGCGFNAFHLPAAGEKSLVGHYTLAGIAAWGEVDIYETGFRAEFARVVTIGFHSKTSAGRLEHLRRAAARYGVPLVPFSRLSAASSEFATPVGPELMPPGMTPPRPKRPALAKPAPVLLPPPFIGESLEKAEGAAVWIGRHVATHTEAGKMRIGPTPALATLLAGARTRSLRGEDQKVAEGDALWVLDVGGGIEVSLPSPAAGTILALNYEGLADPERLLSGPRRDGWIAELELDPAPLDLSPLTWGRAGAEQYRQFVLAAAEDALVLHDIERVGGELGLDDVRMRRSDFDARWRSWRSQLPESPSFPRGRRTVAAVSDLRRLLETIGGVDPGELMDVGDAAA